MQNLLSRTLSAWLAIALAITQIAFSPVMAQTSPDIESPIIEIEAVFEAEAGNTQVFTALVADDRLLKDVTLYPRRAGRQAFERAIMTPRGITGYFSVELETDPADLRPIEYYVQARDEGGNRSISGFAFDPYQREIIAPNQLTDPVVKSPTKPIAQTPVEPIVVAEPAAAKKSSNKIWWAIGLAVVVGVVASSSGGSSGDPARTELTINLPLPQ